MKRRTVESALLLLALLVSLLSVSAFAAADGDDASLRMENVVINDFESTYYNDGGTVINNFGVVYNNGGTVYNNGGTVYNNEGTVYNNGGTVYNNGAEVYNNDGTVHNNGGTVHESGRTEPADQLPAEPEDEAAAEAGNSESTKPGGEKDAERPEEAGTEEAADEQSGEAAPEESRTLHTIKMNGDYSALAYIEGLTELPDGRLVIAEGESATIRAKEGLVLTDAMTTAGSCTGDNSGTVTLANVDRDGSLTLKFRLKAPHASLVSGSYAQEKYLSLSAEAAGAKVLYSTDSSSPLKGQEARGALKIDKSCVLRAVAVMEGASDSEQIELIYVFPEFEAPRFKPLKAGYEAVEPKGALLVNTGLDTVYVQSVRLEGEDPEAFSLSTEKGIRLASGQKDDSTWMIAPAEGLGPGEYRAELVLTLSSGDSLSSIVSFAVKK